MRGSTHAVIGANTVWIPILMGMVIEPWLFLIGAVFFMILSQRELMGKRKK